MLVQRKSIWRGVQIEYPAAAMQRGYSAMVSKRRTNSVGEAHNSAKWCLLEWSKHAIRTKAERERIQDAFDS